MEDVSKFSEDREDQMPMDENLWLAQQYMGRYMEGLADRKKVLQENPYLLWKLDRMIEEMRDIHAEVSDLRSQNEVLKAVLDSAVRVPAAPVGGGGAELPLQRAAGPPAAPAAAAQEPTAVQEPAKAAPKKEKKKITPFTVISNVIFYFCMLMLIVGAVTFAQSDDMDKSLFGFRYYYIKTASMTPVYPVGSVVVTKVTDPADIQVGDDITVYVGDGQSETYLTHRVVEITTDSAGELAFRTKGVNNKSNDPEPFNAKMMVGKVVFHIPVLGTVMTFVRSQLWLVIGIFVLLLALSFMLRLLLSKDEPEDGPAGQDPKKRSKRPAKGRAHHPKRLKGEAAPAPDGFASGPGEPPGPAGDPSPALEESQAPTPETGREGVGV